MLVGPINIDSLSGATMETVGGWSWTTVSETAADVEESPAASFATAVIEYTPAATLFHVYEYGAFVSAAYLVVP